MLRRKPTEEERIAKREAVLADYQLKDENGKYVYTIEELVKKYGYSAPTGVYYIIRKYGGNR